jgi:hypothetical protein
MENARGRYTQDDFNEMGSRMSVLKDFTKLLEYAYDMKESNFPSLDSIASIINMIIDPVDHFLAWCEVYVEIPEEETAPEKPNSTVS